MNLTGKLASVVAGVGMLTSAGNVNGQGMVLYDDFSSGSVNPALWSVGTGGTGSMLDEVGVQNKKFHMQQNAVADAGTSLNFNRTFSAGDAVRYDVDYLNGSGNRISTINVDGNANYTSLFGFWNSLGDGGVGNDFGVYNVKLSFQQDGIYPEITVPSGELKTTRTIIPYPSAGINAHSFGVVARTGHNGTVDMDFYNFQVNSAVIPEPTTLGLIGLGGLVGLAFGGRKKD